MAETAAQKHTQNPTKRTRTKDTKDRPTSAQRKWMARGLSQPGGKLPLFDEAGQKVSARTVKTCLEKGWVEPWFANPIKPNWLICKLTEKGRGVLG